jgi:hypothetical protein
MREPFALIILLAAAGAAFAQEISISANANQVNPRELQIQVTGMPDQQFENFFARGAGHTVDPYKIYIIDHPDEPEINAKDATSTYIQSGQVTQAGFGLVQVPLKRPLSAGSSYLIVVNGIGTKNRLIAKLEPKGTIITTAPTLVAERVKVTAPIALVNKPGDTVVVERKRAMAPHGQVAVSPEQITARITRKDSDGLVLDLGKHLPAGTNTLSTTGLKDTFGTAVPSQGKIEVSSAPTTESDAYVLAKFAASAAVHQAPIFTFVGNIAPLHPPSRSVFWGPVRVDPSTSIDVGLRSTKSANAVIVPAPFSFVHVFGLPKTLPTDQVQFTKVNPYAMQFSFGPRQETDRDFKRLNSLGEFRWELYLHQLSHNMAALKAKLSAQQPQYRDFLELPVRGYIFTPYFQLDTGAHVNDETVANSKTKQSVLVPSHYIVRTYFGVKGTLEFWRSSIDVDGSYLDAIDEETIGYTTSTQALLRRVKGWQPHSKVGFNLFLDQPKHAAFNITFENGRTAPNFEYLNKVDVGFKVIY